MQNRDNADLPMRAMKDIPTPNEGAQRVVALVKKGGHIDGYQLEDGRIVNKDEGIALAKQGGILGVGVSSRNGNEYLKSLPDGSEDNNLGNLPSVTR